MNSAVVAVPWLIVSLAICDSALAQSAPHMRMPVGGTLSGGGGPPRLTGTPPNTVNPFGKHRRFRSFFPYYWPFGYYDGSDGYMYPDDSTEAYTTETQRVPVQPPRDVYPVYDTVTAVGPLQVSTLTVVSKPMVRVSWRDNGVGAKQVAFFLADSSKTVLSAETVRSAPFTAVLEPVSGTAYAGMTVMLPGGTLDTQYAPYHERTR
jgi:hypothetical protein